MSCLNSPEETHTPATSNSSFLLSLRDSWARPYQESAFLKDIPRLVRRVHVMARNTSLLGPSLTGDSGDDSGAHKKSKVEAVVRLLEVISVEMGVETAAVSDIRASVSSLMDDISEEHAIARIFEMLDANGPIIKTLKLINQGVVLHAMSVLREEVFSDIMTKDIRTPEGWQIILRLGDVIQLEHVRTEQSLDAFGDTTNHFEVQWMVMVTFDNELEQLRSCSIRLLRFTPADTMEEEKRRMLRNSLIEGLIVL